MMATSTFMSAPNRPGQGHETAYVQLISNRLGIDAERIRIRQGDTDTIPVGGGTGGARSFIRKARRSW